MQFINENDIRGSLWHRWDLHFHTPSSYEYHNKAVTNAQIINTLLTENIRVVAITDHHKIDVDRITELRKLAGDKITILPGIELRDEHGGDPIHYICIFPEDSNLDYLWTKLQGALNLAPPDIKSKGGDDKIYVPIDSGSAITNELRGIISIHAGEKSNSIESIRNREQFQQRLKLDITEKYVSIMEIGQIKDIDTHLNIIFPNTGLNKPLIICSDNHDALDYRIKAPLWLRADPTFRGLLMILREPRSRVFIGDKPPQLTMIERNTTKYVQSISFSREGEVPHTKQWFDDTGTVFFNPGLIAIVGNKGSGKSALADSLGLLGSSKNEDEFSFLCSKRFRHPAEGYANHFIATLEWESGEKIERCLADQISVDEVERIKYLPQDHVEKICNEIIGSGEDNFEQELKSVIFSHVPDSQRLGYKTLDELVQFKTGEKQKRIDSLIKQLWELGRERANLETENDPIIRRQIEKQIKQKELDLEAHDKAKPIEKLNPELIEINQENAVLIQTLSTKQTEKKTLQDRIDQNVESLRLEERQLAVMNHLLEKIQYFKKDFDTFKASLLEDAREIGITVDNLVTFATNLDQLKLMKETSTQKINGIKIELDSLEPPGLRKQLSMIEIKLTELRLQLDTPNRVYQMYLKELADWQETRNNIMGNDREPESLNGLKATLLSLDSLPAKIADLRNAQIRLTTDILTEKLGQVSIYREFFGPVQFFINSHELAKDKLNFEFRAELSNEDFTGRFLS